MTKKTKTVPRKFKLPVSEGVIAGLNQHYLDTRGVFHNAHGCATCQLHYVATCAREVARCFALAGFIFGSVITLLMMARHD